ncbi:MAG: hypothetical protein AAF227_03680 [Pseudomonadota bacterium]
MPQTIRPAHAADIPRLVALLMLDAQERHALDNVLWRIADDAPAQIEQALRDALSGDAQPARQFWQVSESLGQITGVAHAMLLPVPPIYAGADGPPGLVLPDCFVAPDAPDGTRDALLASVEAVLRAAGARILLAAHVPGVAWQEAIAQRGYSPLTLYLSRTGLKDASTRQAVRPALAKDLPGIVARSAENRRVLVHIDRFWGPHPDADARFAAWMTRSLTLEDRDMFVAGPSAALGGYVIAQPATRLHFPPAHHISRTGVIDDYYHHALADPLHLDRADTGARALLQAAESAFARRGVQSAFVVCPAGWRSKIALLDATGYETAMVWSIKR